MSEQPFVERPDLPGIDSTQTLRAISPSELRDPNQQKWFVVQLAVSDRPVNLEAMPRLDIFAAYRLYAIEGRRGPNMLYSLRLGFFNEEQSAQTICGYVRTFFRSPSVVRVSAAERARFEPSHSAEPSQTAARASSNVVELDSVRAGSRRMPLQRSVTAIEQPAEPQGTAIYSRAAAVKKNASLARELLEEAREIELSKTGRHRVAKQTVSWLARLLGQSDK